MNLEQHLYPKPSFLDPSVDLQHGQFYEVGCASLNRSIHSVSSIEVASWDVVGGQVWQWSTPPEDRLGVSAVCGQIDHPIDGCLCLGIGHEESVDVGL